jgi:hypothetical protein
VALVNEEAAAGQQELIGDRQSDNAQYEQGKDREVTVSRNPLKDSAFH